MGVVAVTALLVGIASCTANAQPVSRAGQVIHLEIRGAIGPATSDYVVRGIEYAASVDAALIVLEMDTPGGLDSAMRDIIKAILASPVPVASLVAPGGSRAASAGTYILYASHIAAMAPATNLGAATPVQIGGTPSPAAPEQTEDDDAKASPGKPAERSQPSGTAMERKAVNDAVAYIRGLAELRGRNADWAEMAVREAASLTAEQAAEQQVIDLLAKDVESLLAAIDGRVVKLSGGDARLATAGLSVEERAPDWRTKLLATLTDPNVAYLLMLVGIYGLIFEGYNPGAILPGVVGAICLLLALFAFQVLSVNYAGLALIALGVLLLVAEAFVPSFGALGLGGIVAFVIGSVILLDTDLPGFAVSAWLIGSIALIASATLLAILTLFMRSRSRPVTTGREAMIGELAEALEDFDHSGAVFVHGERWTAVARRPVRRGQSVRIIRVHDLRLDVEPVLGAD
jgi:membrane-bound serine protease (ClpP class)